MLRNALIFILLFIALSNELKADRGPYLRINTHNGVTVYQRQSQDPGTNNWVSELKFFNANNYDVEISFRFRYICPEREGSDPVGKQFILKAGSSKEGAYDGLFWYPCKGGGFQARQIGYQDLVVKRLDSQPASSKNSDLGNFEKDLKFPKALSGHWLLYNNAIKECDNSAFNESHPCPENCSRIFISEIGENNVTIEYLNYPKGKAAFKRDNNILMTEGGLFYTYYLINNELTLVLNFPKRGPGCKFEYKYKRDD